MPGPQSFWKKAGQGTLVGLGGALLALVLWLTGVLESFEARTWDWRVRLLARPARTTAQVALILLDQKSLDWGQEVNGLSWPWPREVYASIVEFCRRAGVKALGFDVLYLEPSKYGVYDDQTFGGAVAGLGRFVGTLFLGEQTGSVTRWPAEVPEPGLRIDGLEAWLESLHPREVCFPKASFPIPELAAGARLLANVSLSPDADGVYRRARLFNTFDGRAVPSMALAVYLAARPGEAELRLRPGGLSLEGLKLPIDGEARAILRFRGPSGTHPTYSAAAVIQSEVKLQAGEAPSLDPAVFKDKYVLFGFNAPGLLDLRPSPTAGVYSGVEIHATMLDNLLAGDFMRPLPRGETALLALLLALAAGIAASLVSGAVRNGLVYALFLALPPALSLAAYEAGLWLPLMVLEVSAGVTTVGAGLVNYATEGRQKRYLKSAFRQYLSPAVIEELIAHPERLKLGGERRELSIFFSDLQGFTSISEGLSPEELTALLNDYLSAMTDIIQEEGGTIDKFEGDAIIAFWNAPVDQPDHAARAVRAALRCQARLAEQRPAFRQRVGKDLYMRIGLNSGPAVVGNMGSHTRFDYTMLGDAVNLASRLEGINKQFGTYTMVSQATLSLAGKAFPARELSRVAVVGRKEPVTVFEPLRPEESAGKSEVLAVFATGLRAFYEGRFAEAQGIFAGISAQDPPAASYAAKCRELAASPPAAWNGVWVMTSK